MSVNVYTRTHSSFVSNWQFNRIELNGSNKPVSVLFRQSERDSSAPPFRRWNVKCIFFWNVTKVQISHCRREACRRKIRSSKCPSYSNASCLSERTYTYKIDADNQLHNCVRGARCLSRWRCYKYTWKITAEKNNWIAIALITLHRNVKMNYSKSI